MRPSRSSSRTGVRLALGALTVLAVLATERVSADDTPEKLPILVGIAPTGCKNLGEVRGRDQGNSISSAAAEKDGLREARKLGATHVRTVWAGRVGAYTEAYKGVAYKCPAPGARPPATPAPAATAPADPSPAK
jgi:hypothetical protein